ncbi:MAG TPA: PhnD/SsuA/transferrin family substrate-binding protein [Gemmatales bacterium]|nr:PhnD/SsuA/transferrin family substrate-binding protein [Gemmatales bacterium]HMP58849.1 PhnD/SsuA/transferrin family substrate-binding protein [Gemmatales bacterium]
MSTQPIRLLMALLAAGVAVLGAWTATALPTSQCAPIKVALLAQLFDPQDNKEQMLGQMKPFSNLVQKDLTVQAEFEIVDDIPQLKEALAGGRVQIAVMPGLSYGWLRQKFEDVRPLLVATMDSPTLQAVTLVAEKSPLKNLCDLKGQPAALPKRPPLYLRVFLEREWGQPAEKFVVPKELDNAEEAIEAVIDGAVQAAILPRAAVDAYADRKPGRFKRVRVLSESPEFPLPVVAYCRAGADLNAVQKFETALLKADETAEGRQALTLWRLRGFAKPPADYDELARKVGAQFPAP